MEQNNLKVKIKAQWRQELEEEASRLREKLPVQMHELHQREGSIELAHCTAPGRAGFQSAQGYFP